MTNAEKFKEVFGIDFPRDVDMCSSSSADSDMCNSDERMCDYCELYDWEKQEYEEKPYECKTKSKENEIRDGSIGV